MTDGCFLTFCLALLLGVGIGLLPGGKWAELKEGRGYQRGYQRGAETEMERLRPYILHPELARHPERILRPKEWSES